MQYSHWKLNQQTKDYPSSLTLPLCSWILNCNLISIKAISELLKIASVNSKFDGATLLIRIACKTQGLALLKTNLQQKIRLQTFLPSVCSCGKLFYKLPMFCSKAH